jgi:transposase
MQWSQGEHAEDYILYPENISPYLSIDETSLSQGELYTVVTNKLAKGKKGTLVAMIKGTESEKVSQILGKISQRQRNKVEEITLDMAGSMQKIARDSFPRATQVTDRFHVQKLAIEALQDMRIKYRWEAIEMENKEMDLAKELNKKHIAHRFENGDTRRQLLARSRYLLFKSQDKWTPKQNQRAEILFKLYPNLEKAYKLCRSLANIYQKTKLKSIALTKLAKWYDEVEKSGFKTFNTISNSIQHNYTSILNFFENRSTNASAESFNAKIKAFRTQFRGVRNVSFFLYRLAKIYA